MKNIINKVIILFLVIAPLFVLAPSSVEANYFSKTPSKEYKDSFVIEGGEYLSPVFENDFYFTGAYSSWPKKFDGIKVFLSAGNSENDLGNWLEM